MKKSITLTDLKKLKQTHEKITCLTCYDATFANLMSKAGVEILLVGDSLGMVVQGHQTTIPVTVEDICYHVRCVARGNQGALILGDLPFASYNTINDALTNAALIMQAGAHCVKLEGGAWLLDTVRALVERGIPVSAHLGLTPQSVHQLGGFKPQGRDETQARKILQDAIAMEQAGASLCVLECIPQSLAKEITEQLTIPTIGIGAGNQCDGQVLVMHDMLGLDESLKIKFVKNFLPSKGVHQAVQQFIQDVKQQQFPALEHSYDGMR